MKNKEIEELLNDIKRQLTIDEKLGKEIAKDFHKTILSYEGTKLLLSYIEQLQNNRDKAIRTLETLKSSARWERHLYEVDYILDILKGDSDA